MGTFLFLPTLATLLTTFLLLCECKPFGIPERSYQSSAGLNLEIPCVPYQTDDTCFWIRNGSFINTLGGLRFEYLDDRCSLRIRNLTYPEDNAEWECKIADSLTLSRKSTFTNVIVLIEPGVPVISYQQNRTSVTADRQSNLTCESVGGNPMPRIEWFFNGRNITANSTVTFSGSRITSKLSYVFTKANNGQSVQCKTVHPLLTQNVSVSLNVIPSVTLEQKFCAFPFPTRVYWKFGNSTYDVKISLTLDDSIEETPIREEVQVGRLMPVPRPKSLKWYLLIKCYKATLTIANTDQLDLGNYRFNFENRTGIIERFVMFIPITTLIFYTSLFILITVLLLFIRRRTLKDAKSEKIQYEKVAKKDCSS